MTNAWGVTSVDRDANRSDLDFECRGLLLLRTFHFIFLAYRNGFEIWPKRIFYRLLTDWLQNKEGNGSSITSCSIFFANRDGLFFFLLLPYIYRFTLELIQQKLNHSGSICIPTRRILFFFQLKTWKSFLRPRIRRMRDKVRVPFWKRGKGQKYVIYFILKKYYNVHYYKSSMCKNIKENSKKFTYWLKS